MNLHNDIRAIYALLAPITTTLTMSYEDAAADVVRDDEAIYVQRMECEYDPTDDESCLAATYTYRVDVHVERATTPDDRAAEILEMVLYALAGASIGTAPIHISGWERQGVERNTEALYSVTIQFSRMEEL